MYYELIITLALQPSCVDGPHRACIHGPCRLWQGVARAAPTPGHIHMETANRDADQTQMRQHHHQSMPRHHHAPRGRAWTMVPFTTCSIASSSLMSPRARVRPAITAVIGKVRWRCTCAGS